MMRGMTPLLLFPFNGNAREAVGVVEAINKVSPTWDLLGFIDDDPDRGDCAQGNVPVLGSRSRLKDYPAAKLLAVPGRPENYRHRLGIIDGLAVADDRFATVIHPSAEIGPGCSIGTNVLIHAGVVLTVGVEIGRDVAILPNTVLSHDVCVGRGTLIGSGVTIAGGVQIRPSAYVGSGSRLLQDIVIGEEALIGLGSTVIRSVEARAVVAGNPARTLRIQM
tara:strand:- start:809 stop:1471 length:663 start_codon:yes stop_codon:yes gene_type:complete